MFGSKWIRNKKWLLRRILKTSHEFMFRKAKTLCKGKTISEKRHKTKTSRVMITMPTLQLSEHLPLNTWRKQEKQRLHSVSYSLSVCVSLTTLQILALEDYRAELLQWLVKEFNSSNQVMPISSFKNSCLFGVLLKETCIIGPYQPYHNV